MDSEIPATQPGGSEDPIVGAETAPPSPIPEARRECAASEGRGFFRSTTSSILAGILAPAACLALQPVLLPGGPLILPGLRFLNVFWLFGYGVVGLEMLTLAIWLAAGRRLGPWSGVVSGVLAAGALFAGVLGLVLLPFSLIGLMIGIGALGFVPFLTAWAFGVNAARAFRQARGTGGAARILASAILGASLVLGVPGAAQVGFSLSVRFAIRDVAAGDVSAMARLRAWHPVVPRDQLAWAYEAERDPVRKKRLADAYWELTGEDVESRLARLDD